jgi:aminoglycoside phosphotransferase (APT) family kinase protein
MGRQKDKLTRMINAASDIIGEAQRYELLHSLEGMPNHAKLCHGDFVPSNIIVPDDGGAPVILDWAHATQGNGAADCAITYLHLIMNGENDFAEKYLHRYCERQGCTVAYVQSWCSIVAAAELSRGRVHEQDFLMTWVDVVDWV